MHALGCDVLATSSKPHYNCVVIGVGRIEVVRPRLWLVNLTVADVNGGEKCLLAYFFKRESRGWG